MLIYPYPIANQKDMVNNTSLVSVKVLDHLSVLHRIINIFTPYSAYSNARAQRYCAIYLKM